LVYYSDAKVGIKFEKYKGNWLKIVKKIFIVNGWCLKKKENTNGRY
jgi:hypothetical protein